MKGSNVWNQERVYQEGDKLDINIFDLDVLHHEKIYSGMICLCDVPGSWHHGYSDCRGIHKVEYYIDTQEQGCLSNLFAFIEYGDKLKLTDFGKAHVCKEIRFYPELILIDGEEYAILPDGLQLIIRCPDIVYHDKRWCAPTKYLTYRDHAVWCDTIFKEEQK